MSVRRPPLMRKRPSEGQAVVRPTGVQTRAGAVTKNEDALEQTDAEQQPSVDQLLEELSQDASIDAEALAFIKENASSDPDFSQNFEEMFDTLSRKETWTQAIDQLSKRGEIQESEANELIRKIDQALKPLRRRESQIAIEFGRRMQTDGRESALAWYKTETAKLRKAEDETSSELGFNGNPQPQNSDTVQLKSRRPRGPPHRRR